MHDECHQPNQPPPTNVILLLRSSFIPNHRVTGVTVDQRMTRQDTTRIMQIHHDRHHDVEGHSHYE